MKMVFYKKEEVPAIWDEVAPQLERVVDKAVHGEFTVENLRALALKGDIHIGIARKDDGEFAMVMVFEFILYPSGALGANVLAMAGKDMSAFMEYAVPRFKRFCRQAGASWIECSVSPGMERMHRRHGFKTVYRMLRMSVEE